MYVFRNPLNSQNSKLFFIIGLPWNNVLILTSPLRQIPLPRHPRLRALPAPLPLRMGRLRGEIRAGRGQEGLRFKGRVQARRGGEKD